jgi:hypothetical protein
MHQLLAKTPDKSIPVLSVSIGRIVQLNALFNSRFRKFSWPCLPPLLISTTLDI